jgi:hypothetical protein
VFVDEDHRLHPVAEIELHHTVCFCGLRLHFIVGLTFTVQGGEPADLVYQVTMLPVLIATAVLLANELRSLRNVV